MFRKPQLDSGRMGLKPRTLPTRTFAGVLAGACLLLLGGCGNGGSGKIPQSQADSLSRAVEEARDKFDKGKCDEAESALVAANEQVDSLNADSSIRDGLEQLVGNLDDLASTCQPAETTTDTTSTTDTSSTTDPTTTTDSSTTSSTSSTTSTTSSTTSSSTNTEPPVSPPPTNPGTGGTPPGLERKDGKGTDEHGKPKKDKHGKKGHGKPEKPKKPTKEKKK